MSQQSSTSYTIKPAPLVRVSNLTFTYAKDPILKNVSFCINQGEYVGLIGPNGGGKTTLVKLLLGLLSAQKGEIVFSAQSTTKPAQEQMFGYVPQRAGLDGQILQASVYELVASSLNFNKPFWAKLDHISQQKIHRALDIVQLDQSAHRLLGDLSGGQRQRAFLARAIVNQPKLLILDEPTIGIDHTSQIKFFEFLAHLNTKHGTSIILISHEVAAITKQVDKLLCLNQTLFVHENLNGLSESSILNSLYGQDFQFIHHDHA